MTNTDNLKLAQALMRLISAAQSRENRAGDPCGLLEAQAELAAAAKHGLATLEATGLTGWELLNKPAGPVEYDQPETELPDRTASGYPHKYCVQCIDATTGKKGSFLWETKDPTGKHIATSPVFPSCLELFQYCRKKGIALNHDFGSYYYLKGVDA